MVAPRSSAFLAWGSAQLFFVLGVLTAVAFAILSDEVVAQLSLDESALGLLGGVFFVSYALSQLALGVLIGRVPAKWVLGPAAILSALGMLAFAASNGLASALIARGLMGIGLGATFVGVIYLVGQRFGDKFALMSAVSQSVANVFASGLAIASAVHMTPSFRPPFEWLGVLLLANAALIFLFVNDRPAATAKGRVPLGAALKTALCNSQFWWATVFYCGTFGTLLAFADLWNIQFQMNFFAHTVQQSAVMNAMIPLGVTVGGLVAGAWAGRSGLPLPARAFALLILACFVVLLVAPLSLSVTGALMFVIGCGFGSSTLGLAVLHDHLPAPAVPLATSLVVTAACIFGGGVQPLVGAAVSAPHRAQELIALIHSANPDFGTYQRGLFWLLASAGAAVIASFFFRRAPR